MRALGKYWAAILIIMNFGGQASIAKPIHRHFRHHHTLPSHSPIYGSASLTTVINQILSAGISKNTQVGIEIKSMRNGQVLYSYNSQRLLVPASSAKILTATAALVYLGPQYKFSTRFLTDAKTITNGVINGNVYLVHSGDPSLTYKDLTELMEILTAAQIKTVRGNIYVDNTAYDQVNFGPGWIWSDTRYCYSAPINASIINHNCLSLKIVPAKSAGHLASIVPNPKFFYAGIENTIMTKPSWTHACYIRLNPQQNNIISLGGCMPKGRYARGASVVIADVVKYNQSLLYNLFKQHGIRVMGTVGVKAAPIQSKILASHESKPLTNLINDMLKNSDNIIAGSLFKKLGALTSKHPGSWENGSTAVTQILAQKATVGTYQMNFLDGSGLSRNNQVTPAQMLQVLDYAFHNADINYDFISALPVAGVDGTLKHRLQNVAKKIRAKTGTMAGVVSLAGYAMSHDKEPLAFVILVNGHNGNIWKYRETEDKIVTALTNYTRS
jgi:D-alanyl-D-alanine carboxypeptidase/D-alanyl-D-alanine-endopeptidase (penicillin-binding protein 4)